MNKLAYMKGYLDKKALSLPDIQRTADKYTNPLGRMLLLGGAGYLVSKYGYQWLSDSIRKKQIAKEYSNPYDQQLAWEIHKDNQAKWSPWISGIGAAAMGALPAATHWKGIKKGFNKWKDTGNFGDLSAGFLYNKLPESFDKYNSEKSTMVEKQAFVQADFPHVGSAEASGGIPMSSSPYDNSVNDLALGKDFVMPILRPESFIGNSDIPKASSMDLIQSQAPVLGHDTTATLMNGINQSSDSRSGMVSTLDVFKGLTRAGIGAAAGWGLANIMGTIFSQPPALKSKLANYGAIGGALVNSGLLGGAINKIREIV